MKRFYSLFRLTIVRVIILIMALSLISTFECMAQRVFVPTEEGLLVELKEKGIRGKYIGWGKPNFPSKMYNVITDPFKIYIYSEKEIETEEFFVVQCSQLKDGVMFLPPLWRSKKAYYKDTSVTLNRISPIIYEFTLTKSCNFI